jgi:serine/threonine-protein kinase SRPK3
MSQVGLGRLFDSLACSRYKVNFPKLQPLFCIGLLIVKRLEKWVSIKIMTAGSSEQPRELRTIQSLQEKRASNSIVKLLDSFIHQGPNGSHECLVFELLGPTLDTVVADYGTLEGRLEPETILKITEQLLQAVASLHKARYAHGG